MIIFFFLIFLITSTSCYDGPKIRTYYGKFVGKNINVLGKKMTEYLGIPYAFPPVGRLRFKKPLEINKNHFKKTYYAVNQGDACPQIIRVMNFSGYDDSNPTNGTNENCLKLNILGFFGFSYLSGKNEVSGNMGLLDQQMVLKWIKRTIKNFNGNKNGVTIFGTSSGGSFVMAHLFSNSKAAKKVRALGQIPTPFPFAPMNKDTVFFKGSIDDIYKNKYFNKDVDLILGRTADEATFFMATGFTNNTKYNCSFYSQLPANDTKNQCNMNEKNFLNLIDLGAQILKLNETEKNNLTKIYNETATTYTNRSIRLLSDFIFDCELSRFSMIYANVSKKNVYFYEYNRRSPINVWPPWTGAMHGDDLIAMFGIPFRHPKKYNKKILKLEQNYSDNVMWRIGNFTRKGKTKSFWKKLNAFSLEPQAFVFNGMLKDGIKPSYTNVTPPTCSKLFKLIQQSKEWKLFLKNSFNQLRRGRMTTKRPLS